MLFTETETARLNKIIEHGGREGLTELEFFAREITAWKRSPMREMQLTGQRYYENDHDILARKRTAIGPDGGLTEIGNLPNHRIIDNQYAKLVDQKANYLLGKPVAVETENDTYAKALKQVFNRKFQRMLRYLGEDALNGGVAWLYVYYDQDGSLAFRHFPAQEVLPFWADDAHTVLDAACRVYLVEVWDGLQKKLVEKVEIFKPDGLYRYILDGSALIPDVELGEFTPYIRLTDSANRVTAYTWERFPLIAFKYNKQEIPLIQRVKTLQDGINEILSDFQNNMEEDSRNTILVLTNYDGENLAEFRQNLTAYGAVKVRDDGGVNTLQVEVNAENYKAILELYKQAMIENAKGYDAKDDRLSGSPNQMNIQSMYSDIDLDANGMEAEFQAAMEEVIWFVDQSLKNQGLGDFQQEDVQIVFNRDILINESEAIANCQASVGILSNRTIVSQHPWTDDAQSELERLEQEQAEAQRDPYADVFPAAQNGQSAAQTTLR